MSCHGLGCKATDLIKAHIMPRGFARDIKGTNKHNFNVSMTNVQPTQLGVFDTEILCGTCDGHLGVFDDYAIDISRRFNADHVRLGQSYRLPDVDGDALAKFALAVLWRASISKRPECEKVRLGPYEAQAQEVLYGARSLQDMPGFQLMVLRYDEPDAEKLYTFPCKVDGLAVNGWGFALNGFRFIAKMDKRPWPGLAAEGLAEVLVKGQRDLVGLFVPFKGSLEHSIARAMAVADQERKQRKQDLGQRQS